MPIFTQQFSNAVPPVDTTVNGEVIVGSTVTVVDTLGGQIGTVDTATGETVVDVSMAWVTEYDWTPASDGTVNLDALSGSTYTDGEGVAWNITSAPAGAPSFGIHATDGLGVSGTASSNDTYSYLEATIAELVAVGGGPAYDPHTDAVEVWVEYASLSFGGNYMLTYVNIAHHTGASRYDGIGRWTNSGTVLRRGVVDDNVSAPSTVDADGTAFGADGVLAWRLAGTEIGCGYSASPTMGDDFDALTENVSGNKYLGMAVRSGAGDSDAAVPGVSITFVSSTFGATTQRVKRVRVRRWRASTAVSASIVTTALSRTVLLCHFDGSNGATTTTDSSQGYLSPAKIITMNAGAALTTSQKVFGTAGCAFDGANDYLSIPADMAWSIYSGNFFIEFRYRPTTIVAVTGFDLITHFQDTNNRWSIYEYEGHIYFLLRTAGSNVINLADGGLALVAGTWYTIGVEWHNGSVHMYRDGVLVSSFAYAVGTTFNGPLYIGGNPSFGTYKPCTIDELIIVRDAIPQGASYTVLVDPYDETLF